LEREIIPWDVPPEHFAISEIKWVLAAQLMHLNNNGAFLAGEWMTGNEVMDFIHRFHTFQNYFNE